MPRLKKKWLPYEVASLAARKAVCRSRKEFMEWHDANRPDLIPKYPHRVYPEWTSWNDFLGTTNTFRRNLPGDFRPYWDAVRWVQKNAAAAGVNTYEKWLHWYDSGAVPKDIPKYPNNYYPEWKGRGWGVWLGKSANDRLIGEEMSEALIAIATVPGAAAANVIRTIPAEGGIQELGEKLEAGGYRALAIYRHDPAMQERAAAAVKAYGRPQGDGSWIVGNMASLLFELDSIFEKVDLQEAAAAYNRRGAQRVDHDGNPVD